MYMDRFSRFSGLISRAEKALQRAKTENVRGYGLRGVHVSCLLALYDEPEGMTATELAAACGVDRAQVSRVTGELTERGLLEGEAHEGSRRRYRSRLQLTQEGRLAAAQMAGIVDEKLQSVSGGISEEELAVFYRVLDLIVERLEAL